MSRNPENKYVIETQALWKVYNEGKESEVRVVKGIDLRIGYGEFTVIMGPSGSGKTTLLDMIGCLLSPSSGKLFIEGKHADFSDDDMLARIRGEKIGFVFQQFNLLSSASALDNVMLPMRINGMQKKKAEDRAGQLLKIVGLEKRIHHRPGELSGGEQQRVAIARSLANDPKIILADEPTGNLDTETGKKIMGLLKDLNKTKGYTIIVITHDPSLAAHADEVIKLKDGKIVD